MNSKRMIICESDFCSGCGACKAICPQQCVELVEGDAFGRLLPEIQEDRCIECGLCKRVCHVNQATNNKQKEAPITCYAARSSNLRTRNEAASGGIASSMYHYMIQRQVFSMGVYFDRNNGALYKKVEDVDDIDWARDSKYVYSEMDNVYFEFQEHIIQGQECVFIGLPCQVAALKNYLNVQNIQTDRVIFIDIVCHGAPSFKLLREHLDFIEQRKKKKIERVHFRQPKSVYQMTCYSSNGIIWKKKMHGDDPYYKGFSLGLFFRESCYNCPYACTTRVSDITIGDYSGLGERERFDGDKSQMSLVLCNTKKGDNWFGYFSDKENVEVYERPVEEAINAVGNPQLRNPSSKPKQKRVFDSLYLKTGDFEKSAQSAMRGLFIRYYLQWPTEIMKSILKSAYKRLFFEQKEETIE